MLTSNRLVTCWAVCTMARRLLPIWVVRVVSDRIRFDWKQLKERNVLLNLFSQSVRLTNRLPSFCEPPSAARCAWEDGFIMSDLRHTERGFRWSSCSTEQFKHFLNGETSTCLYNYPHENQLLPRVLPGTMLTLDEQCKRDRGTNACFVSVPAPRERPARQLRNLSERF